MAKNDKKHDLKPATSKPSEDSAMPDKIIDSRETKTSQKPGPSAQKPLRPIEPPHKKGHGMRNFVLFIILLLAGAVGFLTVQLKQTEKLNADALNKLQTSYDEKITLVNNKISLLDREVTGLKNRPIVEHAAGISENQLNQKLAALREELELRMGIQPTADEQPTDEKTAETEEKTVEPIVPLQTLPQTPAAKTIDEILMASGAIIVRDLAEQGVNFAYEAEVLQILAQGNELAERNVQIVRNFANSGIAGKNKLIANFNKIFAELNTADIKSAAPVAEVADTTAQKWYQKIWCWLKKQVTAKKNRQKPVFTPQKDEVLELVNEGRIQDALEALNLSEKYAKINSEPLLQWRTQAERYLEFDSAINAIIMNALANIRLKEMEH